MTGGGTLWLDADKVSPYDFYQYWRNVDDADVKTCLSLLTFVPIEEVNRLSNLKDAAINEAKKVLAYEVTKLVHGQDAADMAQLAAEEIFSKQSADNMPVLFAQAGQKLLDVLTQNKVIGSKSEGRRLIAQNGLSIDNQKVSDPDFVLHDSAVVKIGKKKFFKIVL